MRAIVIFCIFLLFILPLTSAIPDYIDRFSFEKNFENSGNGSLVLNNSGLVFSKESIEGNYSLLMKGYSKYAAFNADNFEFKKNGTITMLIKRGSLKSYMKLISGNIQGYDSIPGDGGITIYSKSHPDSNLMKGYFFDLHSVEIKFGSPEINDLKWHFIAFSWGEYIRLYVDGKLADTREFNSNLIGGNGEFIGIGDLSKRDVYLNGFVDDFRYYPHLNDSEIQELYSYYTLTGGKTDREFREISAFLAFIAVIIFLVIYFSYKSRKTDANPVYRR